MCCSCTFIVKQSDSAGGETYVIHALLKCKAPRCCPSMRSTEMKNKKTLRSFFLFEAENKRMFRWNKYKQRRILWNREQQKCKPLCTINVYLSFYAYTPLSVSPWVGDVPEQRWFWQTDGLSQWEFWAGGFADTCTPSCAQTRPVSGEEKPF